MKAVGGQIQRFSQMLQTLESCVYPLLGLAPILLIGSHNEVSAH